MESVSFEKRAFLPTTYWREDVDRVGGFEDVIELFFKVDDFTTVDEHLHVRK